MRVVAITACPTGIAHTYMAADKLTETAKKLGITIKVETQGAMGVENRLTDQDVERADIVICACRAARPWRTRSRARPGRAASRRPRHRA